mmetsp:Transcript_17035/g.38906  ORF Transcript_17035/g.38906 Transcript_17035/m.38906 type:complete len:83 (-) Transcript_17035:2004-2252(-)
MWSHRQSQSTLTRWTGGENPAFAMLSIVSVSAFIATVKCACSSVPTVGDRQFRALTIDGFINSASLFLVVQVDRLRLRPFCI